MKNNFRINSKINTIGTSLRQVLPTVTNKKVKSIFGTLPEGLKEKYSYSIVLTHKDEKGKSGTLNTPTNLNPGKGVYTLYTCYGQWRIGGFVANENTEELRMLLTS